MFFAEDSGELEFCADCDTRVRAALLVQLGATQSSAPSPPGYWRPSCWVSSHLMGIPVYPGFVLTVNVVQYISLLERCNSNRIILMNHYLDTILNLPTVRFDTVVAQYNRYNTM